VKLNVILEKVSFLQFLDKRDWIDGGPHPMFRVSSALYEVMIAQVIRSVAPLLQDRGLGKQLHELGHAMVSQFSKGIVAGWEDGDDICPPWPWPRPWRVGTVPDTAPALSHDGLGEVTVVASLDELPGAVRDVVLASVIRTAARLTSDGNLSLALKRLGEQVIEGVAGAKNALFDDYCGTPVKPRHVRIGPRGAHV
jgi:hypothetical protein